MTLDRLNPAGGAISTPRLSRGIAMVEPVRIIARRITWPDPAARPKRSGLRLRSDAAIEAGELLIPATEYPLADGAHALAKRGPHLELEPLPGLMTAEAGGG